MNEALSLYENEDKVISIHGYVYPVKDKLPETFFLKGADCWGWATWKRGWDLFVADGRMLIDELEKRRLLYEFDFENSYPYSGMLKDQIEGKNNSWAVRWYASAFLKDKLTLYPGRSLVYNCGNDGTGTHSGASSAMDSILSKASIKVLPIKLVENLNAKKSFIKYFRNLFPRNSFYKNFLSSIKKIIKKYM
jgi:hypothetical protein